MKKNKHKYLVGWNSESQCVYGKDVEKQASFTDPMTYFQACNRVKELTKGFRIKRVVYELVEVFTID